MIKKALVFSPVEHRKTIGLLGMFLPFILAFGAWIIFQEGFQSSISSYYHTGVRSVFVGTLWVIGFFLLSYKGYERSDKIAGDLACLFAIGVAVFPTKPDVDATEAAVTVGHVHLVFAVLFFLTLIYFSLFLFTKTNPDGTPTRQKLHRNRVYRICGYIMLICVLLIAVYYFLPLSIKSSLKPYNPVFWFETFAIIAFGVSWFTKSEAILKDKIKLQSEESNVR